MNNPFQNLNTKYTPSQASLYFVLSQMGREESRVTASPLSLLYKIKKSPLYTWSLAGGLSFAGMAAALLFFVHGSPILPPDNNVAIISAKDMHMRNATIDEALNSVANFDDSNTLNNKF